MTKFELPEKPKKTNTSEDFNNLRKAVDELDKFDYAWKTYANKADRRINAANKHIEELERENQRLIAENLAIKTLQQQPLPVVPECVGNFLSGKSIFKIANGNVPDDVISWVQEQTYYVDLEKIISHLISLKITGYQVEKPQLFYLKNKITCGVLVYADRGLIEVSELYATGGEFELENYTFTQEDIDAMEDLGSYEKIVVVK